MDAIYNKLDGQSQKIISKFTLCSKLMDLHADSCVNLIRTLKRSNKICYLFNDYFYILNSDEQLKKYHLYSKLEQIATILNKQKIKWHFGLYSSLTLHNHQIPNSIIIVNNFYSKKIKLFNTKLIFKKQKYYCSIGVKQINSKNRIKLYFSDLERTHLDYLYFRLKSDIQLDDLNLKKLNLYKKDYPKIKELK